MLININVLDKGCTHVLIPRSMALKIKNISYMLQVSPQALNKKTCNNAKTVPISSLITGRPVDAIGRNKRPVTDVFNAKTTGRGINTRLHPKSS